MSTTLQPRFQISIDEHGAERREARRHEFEGRGIAIHRWDGAGRSQALGELVDLSSRGARIRTTQRQVRADQQIRIRLELPAYAGISPFVDTSGDVPAPKREWVGWMSVARVEQVDSEHVDVAGRLVDMEEIDRGMLSLYLSTQPLAA